MELPSVSLRPPTEWRGPPVAHRSHAGRAPRGRVAELWHDVVDDSADVAEPIEHGYDIRLAVNVE